MQQMQRVFRSMAPMFDLSASYYAFDDINHTVVDALARVRREAPAARSVLDVGCGRGRLGGAIRKLGFGVTGIERHGDALQMARQRLDEVLAADLADEEAVAAALGGRRFDVMLFADVLEHVADPLRVLRRYRRFLAPGGRVVISLPNIASWDRRLALLVGRFDYADSGVMDRTHLRFFTFRTAQILVREAGLAVLAVDHAPGIVRPFLPLIKRFFAGSESGAAPDPEAILRSPAYRLYERWLLPAEYGVARLWRGLLAFRIVIVAAADASG